MARPLVWFRLWRGKVWHLRDAEVDRALCGLVDPHDSESVGSVAPHRARVCGECIAAGLELAGAVNRAQAGDPRSRSRGLIGVLDAPLPDCDIGPNQITPMSQDPPYATWSAVAIWRQLLAETEGQPFTEGTYVSWVLREYLNPWGETPRQWWPYFRTRELEEAP